MGLGPAASPRQFSAFADSARLRNYIAKVKGVQAASLIDFWTLNDASGAAVDQIASARNGTYVNSPTLQAATFADNVNKAPSFVASSSQYANVFTSSLASAFNASEGTALIWLNLTAGDWADTLIRDLLTIGVNTNNRVSLRKFNVAKQLRWNYVGNATILAVTFTYGTAPTTWVPMAITWSVTGNRMRAYISGSQTGADQTPLPTWVGSPANLWCNISAFGGPGNFSDGNFAMCALWTKELTAAEVTTISTAP